MRIAIKKKRTPETAPGESGDGLEVIVHRIEPTEADRRRLEQCWRDVIGRRLNEEGSEPGKLSEP
jgi:hypothetical protein